MGRRGAGPSAPPPHPPQPCQRPPSPAGHIWRRPSLVSAASRLPPAVAGGYASGALNIKRLCQDRARAGGGGAGWGPGRPAHRGASWSGGVTEGRSLPHGHRRQVPPVPLGGRGGRAESSPQGEEVAGTRHPGWDVPGELNCLPRVPSGVPGRDPPGGPLWKEWREFSEKNEGGRRSTEPLAWWPSGKGLSYRGVGGAGLPSLPSPAVVFP